MKYTIATFGTVYRSNGPTNGVKGVIRGLTLEDVKANQKNEREGDTHILYREVPKDDPKAHVSRNCRMYGEYVGILRGLDLSSL